MDKEAIKPQFHYKYKSEAVILDAQYNYEGNILAVSTSNGEVYFYEAGNDEVNRDHICLHIEPAQYSTIAEHKKWNALLKIAWSDPNFSMFATASVEKTITLYQFKT